MSAIVKEPNPLFWIGHNVIVIGRKRSRPQNISKRPRNIIKVVITTQCEEVGPASEKTLPHVPDLYK
jgi:hypothetical protein